MSAQRDALVFNMRAAARGLHHGALRRELASFSAATRVLCFEPTSVDISVMGINAMDPKRMLGVLAQARRSAHAVLEHERSTPALEMLRAAA
jgi:hypothetical protein